MTITSDEIQAVAPHVTAKAQGKKGVKNPYITLQSLEALCQGDETLLGLLKDMEIMCLRYAETVCKFEQIVACGQISNEDGSREEIEKVRTKIHDATIDSINILSRNMKQRGKDNNWIKAVSLGSRSSYAKFALLIAFEVVLGKE